MDDNARLKLQQMIKANNVEDMTPLIRELKHSQILRTDVNNMILLKSKYKDDDEKMYNECINECNFLFTYYTDINKPEGGMDTVDEAELASIKIIEIKLSIDQGGTESERTMELKTSIALRNKI